MTDTHFEMINRSLERTEREETPIKYTLGSKTIAGYSFKAIRPIRDIGAGLAGYNERRGL